VAPAASTTGSELQALAARYESSLSWRVTRPLRRLGRALRAPPQPPVAVAGRAPEPLTPGAYDLWLESYWGEELAAIDAACAGAGPEGFALFRDLDTDLWALLLTQEYSVFEHIKALLPSVPEPELQVIWNGTSGATLAAQSAGFYKKVVELHAEHSERPLGDSRVLDFGCGWGRLTRFLARDVAPGQLYGCDPVQAILDVCRSSRVPAELRRCEFVPDSLPFAERFDLVCAFSVFTHLSEPAQEHSLRALHRSIAAGGLLVATIRPPEYLRLCDRLHPLLASLGPRPELRLRQPLYLFAPHDATPLAVASPPTPATPATPGGPPSPATPARSPTEVAYGETVITLAYVRRHWTEWFELLGVDLLIGDPYQVVLTLRRR
jgi:SAM-dependent methyltransferase